MSDDVIRNPHRANIKAQTPHEPEYVRMNVAPVVAPLSTDQMYTAVDGEIIDDIPFDNGHVIDNNDYVNIGYDSTPKVTKTDDSSTPPAIGGYILMVFGKLIATGSIDKIETQVKKIMYGEDPDFDKSEISVNDIVVLKRVDIKVGIFVDR